MSFSNAPSFNDAISTPAAPAASAPAASGASGIGFYDTGTGDAWNPYASPDRLHSNTQESSGDVFNYYPVVDPKSAQAGQFYQSDTGGGVGSYDTSKYASPYLAYLDYAGAGQGKLSGALPTTGLASYVTAKGLDPQALISSYASQHVAPGWLTGPQDFLEIASRKYTGPNADALNQYVADPATQQAIAEAGNYGNAAWQSSHPAMSLHGHDYADIASGLLTVLGAGYSDGAFSGLGGSGAGAADALDSSLVSSGTNGLGAGTLGNYAQSVGTKLAMSAAKKALLNSIAGKSPTQNLVSPSNATAFFADGGIVDSIDFGGDTNNYTSPPDFSGYDPASFDPSSFDIQPIDSSSFGGAYDTAAGLPSSWGTGSGGLGLGLQSSAAPIDPENQGGPFSMSGKDSSMAPSENGPPTASSAAPPVAAEQGMIGKTLQKLGYLNDKGDVNLGAALKAGATIAALATQYLQNKKLATQGAQLASAQLQPAKVFTLPNTALSNYQGSPYAIGKPQNSNSVVQLRAEGGLMRHHLAMGGPPMAGPLGAPTGAMPPSMLPQGGMNRMPGGAAMQPPQQPPPQMPTGGPPAWQNQAPPPSAVPAPANHFAHGGMMEHMGPGAVHGAGGGQDDLVPAQLSPGEYVFDADTVASLGDGSSEEGARRLDAWRKHLREHKRSAPANSIPPKAHAAPHYLGGKS